MDSRTHRPPLCTCCCFCDSLFRPPLLTTAAYSKIAFYGIVASSCYLVWTRVLEQALAKYDPRPLPIPKSTEEPDPIFLPLPFTEKQVNSLPYAGAEEEWKNFIKFNKDEKLKQRVKNDLKMLVKRAAEKNPATKRWAKNGESFQVGAAWLIMSFPERPHPEFVRTGYVAFCTMSVSCDCLTLLQY